MLQRLRAFRNRRRFRRTRNKANPETETICATYVGDRPVYFAMPKDASDAEVRAEAFRQREGRDLTQVERKLLSIAEGMNHAG